MSAPCRFIVDAIRDHEQTLTRMESEGNERPRGISQ